MITVQADPMSGMEGRRRTANQDRPWNQRLQMALGGQQLFPFR
ncbi:MAG TPA: hypothetical protein VKM72_19690 [Thermoanaerobaculia bacterium]|nr:hypothetical protein [Thermoanaerobaculia bacterium]